MKSKNRCCHAHPLGEKMDGSLEEVLTPQCKNPFRSYDKNVQDLHPKDRKNVK